MHFRQRVAWLLLAVYLTATAAVVYYMFEINTQLRIFALDHVDRMHTVAASPLRPAVADYAKPSVVSTPSIVLSYATFFWSMLGHVVDIPLPVIAVLLFILYVQIFCVLWMFTRPEADCLSSCFWPTRLYSVLRPKHSFQSFESPLRRDRKCVPSASVSNGKRTLYVTWEL